MRATCWWLGCFALAAACGPISSAPSDAAMVGEASVNDRVYSVAGRDANGVSMSPVVIGALR